MDLYETKLMTCFKCNRFFYSGIKLECDCLLCNQCVSNTIIMMEDYESFFFCDIHGRFIALEKEIENHVGNIVIEFDQDVKQEICCICYEKKTNTALSCNHVFCSICIFTVLQMKSNCPICRRNVKSIKIN